MYHRRSSTLFPPFWARRAHKPPVPCFRYVRHFAVRILHIDEKIEVGIRPLNACDDTGQRDGFVTVVLRAERMMRQQRPSGQQTTRKYDESHMPPYQVPPPFR